MMELDEIDKFIEFEEKRLIEYYKKDKNEVTMAMGFKVIEEVGELFDEILVHKGYQRKEKLNQLSKDGIEKEFADVIFTILLLAKRFNINIENAIKIKMEEIKNRKY